jgi:hypothetical protein
MKTYSVILADLECNTWVLIKSIDEKPPGVSIIYDTSDTLSREYIMPTLRLALLAPKGYSEANIDTPKDNNATGRLSIFLISPHNWK